MPTLIIALALMTVVSNAFDDFSSGAINPDQWYSVSAEGAPASPTTRALRTVDHNRTGNILASIKLAQAAGGVHRVDANADR